MFLLLKGNSVNDWWVKVEYFTMLSRQY